MTPVSGSIPRIPIISPRSAASRNTVVHPEGWASNSLNAIGANSTPNSRLGQTLTAMDDSLTTGPRKRRRLNFACNYCRARKTRCDEQKPSCNACVAAGIPCVTTNKRRPGVEVERRGTGAGNTAASVQGPSETFQAGSPRSTATRRCSVSRSEDSSVVSAAANTVISESARQLAPGSQAHEGRRFLGRLPMAPRINGSSTLELLTGWLDLAFYRLGVKLNFAAAFAPEDAPDEAVVFSAPPPLPPPDQCRRLIQIYFANFHPLFPLLDKRVVLDILRSSSAGEAPGLSYHGRVSLPVLVLYLVLAIARLEQSEDVEGADEYIKFCKSMIGNVISWHSATAVHIIFLLSCALRWQGHIRSSWTILALCVSIAQTLGFHLQRSPNRSHPASGPEAGLDDIAKTTWWCIYTFEKLSAFEFGRPSTIRDFECDQAPPSQDGTTPSFFHTVVSLAQILSTINERSIRNRHQEEKSNAQSLEAAIDNKVQVTGEVVTLLMKWADELPVSYQLDMVSGAPNFPQVAFLSSQYHNALLIILRNSFLISEDAIRDLLEKRTAGQPCEHVIRSGQAIAANAARSIVRLLVEGADRGLHPVFSTSAPPLHALYVLAVHLMTHLGSRLANSDIDLMNNALEITLTSTQCGDSASQEKLRGLVSSLTAYITSRLTRPRPSAANASTTSCDSEVFAAAGFPSHVGHSLDTDGPLPTPTYTGNSVADDQEGMSSFNDIFQIGPNGNAMDSELFLAYPDEIGWDWGDVSQLLRHIDHDLPGTSDLGQG